MATVLVTGATGALGREVVAQVLARGAKVRALVRGATDVLPGATQLVQGDLLTCSGLAEAMGDIDAIVHCATGFGADVDAELIVARRIIEFARKAGVPHLVYISIVGVDQSAFSYFKAKFGVEQLIQQSELPFSILRATQFHAFVLGMIRSFQVENNTIRLPKGLVLQPIAVTEVAEELATLALQSARGLVPAMAGPQILTLEAMACAYVDIVDPELAVSAHLDAEESPSEYHEAFRTGHALAPDRAVGRQSWREYLHAQKQMKTPGSGLGA